jgi:ribosomal protein S27E
VINRSPRCVYVSDTLGVAEIVAGWLKEQDIAAEVMDTATLGGFDGKTSITPWVASNRGIEVWVPDADVDRARELLAAKTEEFRLKADQRATRTGTVEAVCEECGHSATFAASAAGTVEDCPSCGAYLDVPDPDEQWDDMEPAEDTDDAGPPRGDAP